MISELLVELAQRGVRLKADGDRLLVDAPKGAISRSLADRIREAKAEILSVLMELEATDSGAGEPIEGFREEATGTVSITQERHWFIDHMNRGSGNYNLAGCYRLLGPLNYAALNASVEDFVQRHRLLQVCFKSTDGSLRLEDHYGPITLERHDFLGADSSDSEIRKWLEETACIPFELSKEPMFRVYLIKLKDDEHLLFLVSHAIIWDGWCYDIFLSDLGKLYEAHVSGKAPDLPAFTVRYDDFAYWQRRRVQSEHAKDSTRYWIERLKAHSNQIALPTDRPRSSQTSHRGARENFAISSDLVKALQAFAVRERATPNMVLLAAYAAVLGRYAGTNSIIITTSVRARDRHELEGLIGPFVNRLFLCFDLSGNPTFAELIRRVKYTVLDGLAHQDVPFEALLQELNEDLSQSSLFQIEFTYQNTEKRSNQWDNIAVKQGPPRDFHAAHADIAFWVRDGGKSIDGAVDYRTDLYDQSTIARLIRHVLNLLRDGIDHAEKKFSYLNLMNAKEMHQVLSNCTAVAKAGFILTAGDRVALCIQSGKGNPAENWIKELEPAVDFYRPSEEILEDEWDLKRFLELAAPVVVVLDSDSALGLLGCGWRPNGIRLLIPAIEITTDLLTALLAAQAQVWGFTSSGDKRHTVFIKNYQSDGEAGILGNPVSSTTVRILDSKYQLVPIGIDGVAYVPSCLGIPDSAIVMDPVDGQPLRPLGINARWTATGELMHRSDNVIMSLFYEETALKTIERELRRLPGVRDACVAVRSHGGSSPKVVAWVLQELTDTTNHSGFRAALCSKVPERLLPGIFIRVDQLLRNQSGLVDARQLRDPYTSALAVCFEPPRTGLETQIAQIWRRILGVERISAHDNFAELGGTSLQALRALRDIQDQLGWQFSPRLLFFQTLRQMAERAAADDQSRGANAA